MCRHAASGPLVVAHCDVVMVVVREKKTCGARDALWWWRGCKPSFRPSLRLVLTCGSRVFGCCGYCRVIVYKKMSVLEKELHKK
jgi:hypothetical protein